MTSIRICYTVTVPLLFLMLLHSSSTLYMFSTLRSLSSQHLIEELYNLIKFDEIVEINVTIIWLYSDSTFVKDIGLQL